MTSVVPCDLTLGLELEAIATGSASGQKPSKLIADAINNANLGVTARVSGTSHDGGEREWLVTKDPTIAKGHESLFDPVAEGVLASPVFVDRALPHRSPDKSQ